MFFEMQDFFLNIILINGRFKKSLKANTVLCRVATNITFDTAQA